MPLSHTFVMDAMDDDAMDDDMMDILALIPPEQPFKKSINSVLNKGSRTALKEVKQLYITQTTSAARKLIFRNKILPTIYKYWKENADLPGTSEESAARIKVLFFLMF